MDFMLNGISHFVHVSLCINVNNKSNILTTQNKNNIKSNSQAKARNNTFRMFQNFYEKAATTNNQNNKK